MPSLVAARLLTLTTTNPTVMYTPTESTPKLTQMALTTREAEVVEDLFLVEGEDHHSPLEVDSFVVVDPAVTSIEDVEDREEDTCHEGGGDEDEDMLLPCLRKANVHNEHQVATLQLVPRLLGYICHTLSLLNSL